MSQHDDAATTVPAPTTTADASVAPPPPPPGNDPPASRGFAELGLGDALVAVLEELGYEEPTPIQAAAIPPLVAGRDVLGQAATGTGKTAAFALPLLQNLAPRDARGPRPTALVLVPTRELAMQVSEAVHRYGRGIDARVLPVYGGQPIFRQLKALERGVDVVVATPGRAIDHLERGSLDLAAVETLVLDEADEMLDMGFADELEQVLSATPDARQTALFSATLPKRIAGLAKRHLHDPHRIRIEHDGPAGGEDPRIREVAYVVQRHHKSAALGRVLDVESPDAAIVFCRTRKDVDDLTATMNGRGYRAEALHGGMSQEQRDRVMQRLRAGTTELLVATDVAARGLDVDVLTHVVNHSVPSAPESYVHRIGRVGRAGREGVAITLVEPREHRALKSIERHTGRRMEIDKVPTVADLRARRLELHRAALRERLLAEDLDTVRPVLESLADEFDVVEIALAAIALLHEETASDADDRDVPDASLPQGGPKGQRSGEAPARRAQPGRDRPDRADRPGRDSSGSGGAAGRIWINLGREAGIRPKDLVGAIANETRLAGRDVGAIQIHGRFSLVDVPDDAVDEVVAALGSTKLRGRKAHVRRDRVG